jgi:hypothetical protein
MGNIAALSPKREAGAPVGEFQERRCLAQHVGLTGDYVWTTDSSCPIVPFGRSGGENPCSQPKYPKPLLYNCSVRRTVVRRSPSEEILGKLAAGLTVLDGFYLDELSDWVRRNCQLFTCYNVSRAFRFSISGWCPKLSTRALPCPHPLSHQNQDRQQISGRRRLQTHLSDLLLHRQRPT